MTLILNQLNECALRIVQQAGDAFAIKKNCWFWLQQNYKLLTAQFFKLKPRCVIRRDIQAELRKAAISPFLKIGCKVQCVATPEETTKY